MDKHRLLMNNQEKSFSSAFICGQTPLERESQIK
jgi:hypothetical protein